MTRRVVVTGIGLVTPVGHSPDQTFDALCAGKTGTRRVPELTEARFGGKALDIDVAATVVDLDPEEYVDKKEARRMDPFILYTQVAAIQAWRNAKLPDKLSNDEGERATTLVGVSMAGVGHILDAWETLKTKGSRRISPLMIPSVIGNLAPGHVGMRFNLRGPNWTPASMGSSGAHAYGEALTHIRDGRADLVVAGGAESVITPIILSGLVNMGAMSKGAGDPAKACRPFDQSRDGTILGEGGGILVLEERERAKARGAPIYAELAGFASAQDEGVPNFPLGPGLARALAEALEDAGVRPSDVGYINAHGSGVIDADRRETHALREVLGAAAETVVLSSTKGATGDLLGAAGGVEGAITAMAVARAFLPPTANLENVDPECGPFQFARGTAVRRQVDAAVCMNFGIGGMNTALVFKKHVP